MANSYELIHVGIDLSSGSPVITGTARVRVSEVGTDLAAARSIAPQGAALTRTNAVVEDARAYLSAQFGVTLVLPTP